MPMRLGLIRKSYHVSCSSVQKQQSAESKLEGLDNQLSRLKTLTDDLQRQLTDLNAAKSRLTSENFELLHVNQEYETQVLNLSKAKSALESNVDDLKRSLDDEAKVSEPDIQWYNAILFQPFPFPFSIV